MILAMSEAVAADRSMTWLMSADDLKAFCLDSKPGYDAACAIFIQGVVETWSYRDVISANPPKFSARNLAFCEDVL
jgi:hypothetical protein